MIVIGTAMTPPPATRAPPLRGIREGDESFRLVFCWHLDEILRSFPVPKYFPGATASTLRP